MNLYRHLCPSIKVDYRLLVQKCIGATIDCQSNPLNHMPYAPL